MKDDLTRELSPLEKFDRWVEWQEKTRPYRESEAQRISRHAPECFGTYGRCISCGCWRDEKSGDRKACVSHRGSPAHQAYLTERLIAALEARP